MDNKRKVGSSSAGGATDGDGDDRAAKRRKVPGPMTDYDLNQGESPESTTAYGLHFLEMIRRTKDKSGRTVADYFENLLPREGNTDYYRRIKMPISLKTIERKLNNQDFANLAELESYFKRMVTNAKEYYHKGSEVFEDAERVRKALSNYMTKTNPAYKLIPGYSCQATAIPEDGPAQDGGDDDDDDAEGEDEDAEGDEDSEGEEESDADDDDGDEDRSRKKIILKRRGAARAPRNGSTPTRKADRSARKADRSSHKADRSRSKPDHEYEGVPYDGLSFQHAQEKIVEELIRKPDGSDPYFFDFINLPPRNYKEYYSLVADPLSLKMLQKLVKGVRGRQPATGVSEFKGWAALEEKASLLWKNAHFFNEPNSFIYAQATELKECFEKELSEAKAVVQEPPQPKIKLKVAASGQETPVVGPKKITIHVGKGGSAAPSPAPVTGQSSDSGRGDGAPVSNGDRRPPSAVPTPGYQHLQVDKARSLSASVASPSPSAGYVRPDGALQPSPAMLPRTNGNTGALLNTPNGMGGPVHNAPHFAPGLPIQNGHAPVAPAPPPPPPTIYDKKYRAPGRSEADALIPSLLVRTSPSIPIDRKFRLEVPAHPKIAQQNITVHVPPNNHRLQIIPRIAPLEQQQRQYRLFVMANGQLVGRATPIPIADDPIPPHLMVFDVSLQLGTNLIVVTMIAALPKGQKLPNGAECELERITINAYLARA